MKYEIIEMEDHFDAFMWAYALYYWLTHNHEGQWSDRYAVMSNFCIKHNITNIPDIDFDLLESEDLYDDENYKAIENYHLITEENWEQVNKEFEHYMDHGWDKDE